MTNTNIRRCKSGRRIIESREGVVIRLQVFERWTGDGTNFGTVTIPDETGRWKPCNRDDSRLEVEILCAQGPLSRHYFADAEVVVA